MDMAHLKCDYLLKEAVLLIDYREILRLHSLGTSRRSIAQQVQSSRDTVATTITVAKAAGISWPLDDDVTNQELQELLFPGRYALASPYTIPDYEWIHRELAKTGVTLTLLWGEYCTKVRNDGGVPYMYTQFGDKYRKWARITKATMRITHKPGDAMQVDWAGDPLYITDPVTGDEEPAYIFVAVLPCSWYTYAEPCTDMKSENWLLCHVHTFEYYGGVPRLLIPDNTRTATIKNTRYETILNKSYQELADHYDTAIVPARTYHPDDKAAAEGSVRFVSTWITAALRDRKFFSIAEARQAVAEKLEELNARPFKKRPGSRKSAFDEEEKEFLRPLPKNTYEPSIWLNPKVGTDYLVTDRINKYSVPFDLIGENVDVRVTKSIIDVYYHGARVATHVRVNTPQREPIVKPEHMPEAHRKFLRYNAEDFETWATNIGPKTFEVVHHFLTGGKEAEQGYKSCASLTKLEKTYGAKRLEDACDRVLALASEPTVRNITLLIKTSPRRKDEADSSSHKEGNSHGITRGAAYYSKGGQHNE